MEIIFSVVLLVALVSLYDYFAARRWQQVTSAQRNELVFEHRNKAYGAYVIRRDYDKRMIIILSSVILGIGLIYGTYMIIKAIPEEVVEEPPVDMSQFSVAAPPVEEVEPPPVEEEIPPMEQTIAFLPPIVTDDVVENQIPPQDAMVDVNASTTTNDEENNSFAPPPVDNGTPPPVETKPEEVYLDVEESAEFPGGRAAMMKYLAETIKYPEVAIENNIEGKCYLRFIVGTDGKITDVKVTRPVPDCPECDAEAKRVVKGMPRWKPGKIGGKGVRSYFDLPVNFKLN
jgi:protein TonB